ncbi:TIGR02530 family flagellar biosynthesis protein [Cytobacillus gottheilii]|uniref:Flagellar protein n=1 Tax=Cytobacillus gottheilii TaxID=859144 RepID=A0ABX8FH27_9BACI|nr:TIGR02530 family flagellar biosynthesis protein [Cytobacillus gottheilii]QVY63295.1 flagellar protein [Cytobacillus gottheilii]
MSNYMFRPIHTQPVIKPQPQQKLQQKAAEKPFTEHLKSALGANEKLLISKHAKERLQQRGITIDDEKWKSIESKVSEAKRMGVKEALVLLKDAALIVSANNQTVITAMDRTEAESQIFTNITGTIVMD